MKQTTVAEVMTRDVVAIEPGASFKHLAQLIAERRVGAMPVVDAAGRVVGVVSESDLLRKEATPADQDAGWLTRWGHRTAWHKARGRTAGELMTRPAITVGPETSLADAARRMTANDITHLPVVDGAERLVGIVSRGDLLTVFLADDNEIRDLIERDVVKTAMLLDPAAVTVTVDDGVVTLAGTLDRKSDASTLVHLTTMLDGVVGVIDGLSHRWDDTHVRIEPQPWEERRP